MTTLRLFLAIVGMVAVQTTVILLQIKAKVDPLYKKLDTLVQFMKANG